MKSVGPLTCAVAGFLCICSSTLLFDCLFVFVIHPSVPYSICLSGCPVIHSSVHSLLCPFACPFIFFIVRPFVRLFVLSCLSSPFNFESLPTVVIRESIIKTDKTTKDKTNQDETRQNQNKTRARQDKMRTTKSRRDETR